MWFLMYLSVPMEAPETIIPSYVYLMSENPKSVGGGKEGGSSNISFDLFLFKPIDIASWSYLCRYWIMVLYHFFQSLSVGGAMVGVRSSVCAIRLNVLNSSLSVLYICLTVRQKPMEPKIQPIRVPCLL